MDVRFLYNVSRELIASAYHEADLFLSDLKLKCPPLVLFEAMAPKTPFVHTNCGNASELARGTASKTREEMVRNIKILSENDPRRLKFGFVGWADWAKQYQWKETVDKYEKRYESLRIKR